MDKVGKFRWHVADCICVKLSDHSNVTTSKKDSVVSMIDNIDALESLRMSRALFVWRLFSRESGTVIAFVRAICSNLRGKRERERERVGGPNARLSPPRTFSASSLDKWISPVVCRQTFFVRLLVSLFVWLVGCNFVCTIHFLDVWICVQFFLGESSTNLHSAFDSTKPMPFRHSALYKIQKMVACWNN